MAVRPGVAVRLPVGVGLATLTLITTVSTGPKLTPLSSEMAQNPVNLPVLLGAVKLTERSTVWPGATAEVNGTFACPPIDSP